VAALRVISVTGGKGGVGKSHLVANLGVVAARRGLRSVVIDADAGLASVHVLFGLEAPLHVGDVLDGATLDEALLRTTHGLSILPAASGERSLTFLAQSQQLLLRELWDALAERFDVILIDCPPGLHRDALLAAASAERVLLVATPEPTSLVDAATLAQTLHAETAVRTVDVVVNGTRSEKQGQLAFGRLQGLAATAPSPRLAHLGSLPDDHNVRRAAALSRPLVTLAPSSPAARAVERLAVELFDAEPRPLEHVGGAVIGVERRLREAGASSPTQPGPHTPGRWAS
jgi:flagellar biosynthesis protein FlhG